MLNSMVLRTWRRVSKGHRDEVSIEREEIRVERNRSETGLPQDPVTCPPMTSPHPRRKCNLGGRVLTVYQLEISTGKSVSG